jgi:hypothetical protein
MHACNIAGPAGTCSGRQLANRGSAYTVGNMDHRGLACTMLGYTACQAGVDTTRLLADSSGVVAVAYLLLVCTVQRSGTLHMLQCLPCGAGGCCVGSSCLRSWIRMHTGFQQLNPCMHTHHGLRLSTRTPALRASSSHSKKGFGRFCH